MNRREFLQLLSAASAAGMALPLDPSRAAEAAETLYDAPAFGNVCLLHITDCHAQLRPIYFREPSVNLGIGAMAGRPPHLVGEAFLKHFGIAPNTRARARLHLSRFRTLCACLRQGRRLRASGDAGEAAARDAARRVAARRRRYLAGLGRRAVDQGPGHGGRGQAARRRRHDPALGMHLWPGAREARSRKRILPARSRSSRRTSRPPISAIPCSSPTSFARSTA